MSYGSGDDSRMLAGLLALADGDAPRWLEDDLAAMWRHQLAAPLQLDLGASADGDSASSAPCAAESGLTSFQDLLNHPNPPLELLRRIKQYAKAASAAEHGPLPRDIGLALYYAAIATARVRLRESITDLDDGRLAAGLRWALRQNWLDGSTRALLLKASSLLRGYSESEQGS